MLQSKKTDPVPAQQKTLRLWPGVSIVILQWLTRFAVPLLTPDFNPYDIIGGMLGGVAILVWWLFFSRAPWSERLIAVGVMIVALAVTPLFLHESIATGAMGMLFFMYAIPVLSLAFVLWAVVSRKLPVWPRRLAMVASILFACGVWTLFRTGGFTGDVDSDFAWRWSKTPEQRLLAAAGDEPLKSLPDSLITTSDAGWPGFRGPQRDGIVRGVQIETDWSASPPVELWRRPVGPGWSSFAVRGELLYTQEQRGEEEVVSCYNLTTGDPVWRHSDKSRFWESNGGAGPRGTPTISGDRIYTFGGLGILNALQADDGSVVWSRNAAADTEAKLPTWGFSSSPLVVDSLVIVAASGTLIAYDLASGNKHWLGPVGKEGYCSPQLFTIAGTEQIVQISGSGIAGVAVADGTLLWEHPWSGYPIVQPALTADGDILLSVNAESGLRRLAVSHKSAAWSTEERWTSLGLKPYFNDFVIHNGYAYGFDGRILSCVDLADGKRQWKGGRYGSGQLILLEDQSLLLVVSEKGELALVSATPGQFTELARIPAITGKTWNHPVLVGDILLVRNAQEMAAFRLTLKGTWGSKK